MKNLTKKLCFLACFVASMNAMAQVPTLNSLAQAKPTIFLDFDGQTVQTAAWQNGNQFVCAPAALTPTQITEIFNRVSEDFRPFVINVTTDSTMFINAPATQRVRVIVTPTSAWYPNAGGVSYNGVFTWGDDVPAFVFTDKLLHRPKNIAECCTHETGHSLGLSHQAKYDTACRLKEQYSTGYGTGETGWAPVMGNSYGKNMTGWTVGPTPSMCSDLQDNTNLITSLNGISFRADDYSEAMAETAEIMDLSALSKQGIISTGTDKDAFKMSLAKTGFIHLEATPFNLGANDEGANLDIALSLYNNQKELIRTYNPLDKMNVVLDTTLSAGTYYWIIDGAGNNNADNYSSLGTYSITGFSNVLPIKDIALKGSIDKGVHKLTWQITADEPVTKQVLEMSTNGVSFSPIFTDVTGVKNYTNKTFQNANSLYRLKAFTMDGKFEYSNTVSLKQIVNNEKLFKVQTITSNNVLVNATEKYTYQLYNSNGMLVKQGNKNAGAENIDTQNLQSGMYILQMMSNGYKQTERILKQ